MKNKIKNSPKIIAFLQVAGLTIYIALFATISRFVSAWTPSGSTGIVLNVIFFLLVLILSALVSFSLILGYPIKLFIEGKRKLAIFIIIWSIVWIFIFAILALLMLVILK